MTTHKRNPKIGKHPDLYAKRRVSLTQIDEEPDDTDVVVDDWRDATPADLMRAVENALMSQEDMEEMFEEMNEYVAQAHDNHDTDGGVQLMVDDGLSYDLADAVANGLRSRLQDLDEKGREARAKPFIDYIREGALSYAENEIGDENGDNMSEGITDGFQSDLSDANIKDLAKAADEVLDEEYEDGIEAAFEGLTTPDGDDLDAILRDPGIYNLRRHEGYGRVDGTVWSWSIGVIYDQRDGFQYDRDGELEAIVRGGEYHRTPWGPRGRAWEAGERDPAVLALHAGGIDEVVTYPGLSDEDLAYAVKELENDEPYISFGDSYRKGPITPEFFEKTWDYSISGYESDHIIATVNAESLRARLAEVEGQEPAAVGPASDDVVYVYAGTNEFVAGASSRGLYVARLTTGAQLKRESAQLGHCLGNRANGHPQALANGETRVYSIRTEAGKSKFSIELKYAIGPTGRYDPSEASKRSIQIDEHDRVNGAWWYIAEIKGKANRLPGFEPGKDKMTKPDDVRLVTDFLMHLGYSPEQITRARDIAPGVTAMLEAGVDPFKPPVKRVRPPTPPGGSRRPPTENPADAVAVGFTSSRVRALLARTAPMGSFRLAR